MSMKNNDVRVLVYGREKYIPKHLADNAAFCKENGITLVSQPPRGVAQFQTREQVAQEIEQPKGDEPSQLAKDLHWKTAAEMVKDFQSVEHLEAWAEGETRKSVVSEIENRIKELSNAN